MFTFHPFSYKQKMVSDFSSISVNRYEGTQKWSGVKQTFLKEEVPIKEITYYRAVV